MNAMHETRSNYVLHGLIEIAQGLARVRRTERRNEMANRENIRKWVDALRSGRYEQTTGRLANREGYCCLGVACEVAIDSGVKLSRDTVTNGTILYDGNCDGLPYAVSEWLGLFDEDEVPITDPVLHGRRASLWNDVSLADFPKIAALIEEEFLKDPGEETT